jgi:hypothetical protein
MALAAAAQAWRDAGLGEPGQPSTNAEPRRVGMYLGGGEGSLDYDSFWATNLAGWDAETRQLDTPAWAESAYQRMSAVRELEQEPNAALSHLASAFGCRGPAFNCMTACAAGTQSIGEASELIRRGDADVMLAGGAHSMIHTLGMTGFIRLTAMSKRRDDPQTAARPFDQTRDGFVMGEGAGIVILESLEHAQARGATPIAELAGYGSSADAFRITDMHPDGKGALAAMHGALRQAGIDPAVPREGGRPPVDYISAHGPACLKNPRPGPPNKTPRLHRDQSHQSDVRHPSPPHRRELDQVDDGTPHPGRRRRRVHHLRASHPHRHAPADHEPPPPRPRPRPRLHPQRRPRPPRPRRRRLPLQQLRLRRPERHRRRATLRLGHTTPSPAPILPTNPETSGPPRRFYVMTPPQPMTNQEVSQQ